MSLSRFNNFNKVSTTFRNNRQQYNQIQKDLGNYIETNIVEEKKALESAMKNYNTKVESLLKNKEDDTQVMKQLGQQINDTLTETYEAFAEASDNILKSELSIEEKETKIQELSEYILNNLYTKEEVDQFQKMINEMVMIVPNERRGYSQKLSIGNSEQEGASITYN
jgi:hypothetical protein